jgi:hypothetical protein
VQVAGVAWRAATRILVGVGDLVQRTGDGHTGRVLGGQAIERSGGTMCGLYRARGEWFGLKATQTVSHRFEPQNRWWRSVSGLASKPLEQFSPV